jgi:tripartite-type tricarboxylate transporter receptor subunit TctC
MRVPRRRYLRVAASAAVTLSVISALSISPKGRGAWSQTNRIIKIIVPFAPGGGTDVLARLVAEQIGQTQGTTVLVENRPGGGSAIGTEAVARATPDGNTLLVAAVSFVTNPHLRKLNYDPLTSFAPICHLANSPLVIVVNSASPYRTLADLLDAARAKPGDLTIASVGPASSIHVAVEMLNRAANVKMTYVPYSGTALAINALLGGHVTSVFAEYPTAAEQLKAGKLRALATASQARTDALPNVPTVAEAGYKDYESDGWWGAFAPAKTPKKSVSQLEDWFAAAMQAPAIRSKLAAQGVIPVGRCGEDFAAYLRKQYEVIGNAIREANMKEQ